MSTQVKSHIQSFQVAGKGKLLKYQSMTFGCKLFPSVANWMSDKWCTTFPAADYMPQTLTVTLWMWLWPKMKSIFSSCAFRRIWIRVTFRLWLFSCFRIIYYSLRNIQCDSLLSITGSLWSFPANRIGIGISFSSTLALSLCGAVSITPEAGRTKKPCGHFRGTISSRVSIGCQWEELPRTTCFGPQFLENRAFHLHHWSART